MTLVDLLMPYRTVGSQCVAITDRSRRFVHSPLRRLTTLDFLRRAHRQAEWGHPSDNLGAILAITSYLANTGQASFTIKDVLDAMIQAHEIQVSRFSNSWNLNVIFDAITLLLYGNSGNHGACQFI